MRHVLLGMLEAVESGLSFAVSKFPLWQFSCYNPAPESREKGFRGSGLRPKNFRTLLEASYPYITELRKLNLKRTRHGLPIDNSEYCQPDAFGSCVIAPIRLRSHLY